MLKKEEVTPLGVFERLCLLGEDWAKKNAVAELAEENKKTLLADIARRCNEPSVAAREQAALCDDDYQAHIKGMTEARREANIAKVKYDSAKVWFECWRTMEANERAANKAAT